MSFFGKLMHIARLYRWYSKEKALAFKNEELEIREALGTTTYLLHKDIYNEELQGVSQYAKGENERH